MKTTDKSDNELIGYMAPDGSTVSVHDYEYLSSSQQKQCRRYTKEDFSKDRTTQQIKPGDTAFKERFTKLFPQPEAKPLDEIKKMVSQYTPEELERRENHVATPTFPELEKAIENLTEEDMRKIQERVNKYLQTNKIPQPEPEESQEELAGEIVNAIWNLCEDSSHLVKTETKVETHCKECGIHKSSCYCSDKKIDVAFKRPETKDRFDNVCVRCEFPSSFDTDGRKRCIHCGTIAGEVPQPEPEESQDELWDEVEDILTNPARAAADITHYFTIQRKKQ